MPPHVENNSDEDSDGNHNSMNMMEDHSIISGGNVRVQIPQPASSVVSGGRSAKSYSADTATSHHKGTSDLSSSQLEDSLGGSYMDAAGESSLPLVPSITKTTMRIRITNEQSRRSKDLVVDITPSITVFHAVYDHSSVKEAHVRKWGSEVVQKVKQKVAEIKCAVWDEQVGQPSRVFSIQELKETTTKSLYESMEAENTDDLVQLVLQCVDKDSDVINEKKEEVFHTGSTSRKEEQPTKAVESLSPPHAPPSSPPPAAMRCPFSGVAVDSLMLDKFKDHIRSKQQEEDDDDDSNSNSDHELPSQQLQLAGETPSNHEFLPTREPSMEGLPFGSSDTITSASLKGEESITAPIVARIHPEHQDSSSSDRISTPPQQDDISSLEVRHPISVGGETLLSLDLDMESSPGAEHLALPVAQKQNLRIRVSNRTSHRFKDLVVDISDRVNLVDAVYNNQGVKDAHVRKWGPQIVQDVKQNLAEIQMVVWDDVAARPWRTFQIEELKTTSTQDLYETVSESCDLVKLFLECVKIKTPEPAQTTLRSENGNMQSSNMATSVMRLENGKPQSTAVTSAMMRHSKSESCLKRNANAAAANKRGTRLNHMAISDASVGSSAGSSSRTSTNGWHLSLEEGVSNYRKSRSMTRLSSRLDHGSRRRGARKMDVDALRLRGRGKPGKRSLSSEDVFSNNNFNATWNETMTQQQEEEAQVLSEETSLSSRIQRFLQYSQSTISSRSSLNKEDKDKPSPEERLKEFQRLCNAKKVRAYLSPENVRAGASQMHETAAPGSQNAIFPTIVQTRPERENPFLSRVSSLTLQGGRPSSTMLPALSRGGPNASFGTTTNPLKESDRISRFLRFSQSVEKKTPSDHNANRGFHSSMSTLSLKSVSQLSLDPLKEDHRLKSPVGSKSVSALPVDPPSKKPSGDIPPIAEIEVIKSEDNSIHAASSSQVNTGGGISLSPALVREVFPYHVVLDADFRILQVGNTLAQLIDEENFLGRMVSDILMVTSPVPMFGKWDWNIMDKMKDKTIFLESVLSNSTNTKVKIKGTIIEVSASPRTVMLALFPNVKNLSELESMDLSMGDLPLHSCQREAVLLGEHSKSEIKLTNHLDQLHRDLIDSMEKQIEERTNELGTANQDLEQANLQLAFQSARQLEHFACMSHEIRTPLNCIVGMSSLLLDDADEMEPMHADSIRMINTSGDLLKAVVDDVLDYAKLESGSFEVDIKPINLQETLASVVHSISQKVQEKNIRLRTRFSPTLPLILETDSRRLQQVLFNLLGNAGKFSKHDSVIDLSVTLMTGPLKQEEGRPVIYSTSGQIIRFAVIDYGKGIDKKDFKTIFEPFSQASKETQNVYGGTGLGLSITSKLVHRLGGTVGLDSEPGKYTEFTVDLPFAGIVVDVKEVRSKLNETTIIVVEPPRKYDYSFTEHTILQEPIPFDNEIVKTYGLDVVRCTSMAQAFSEASSRVTTPEKTRHMALLVHESLYDYSIADRVERLLQSSDSTVMTFGPDYAVQQTREWHFKSILGFFPAALLDTIASNVFSQRQAWGDKVVSIEQVQDDHPTSLFASLESETTPNAEITAESRMKGGLFGPLYEKGDDTKMADTTPSTGPKGTTTSSVEGGLFASISDKATQETELTPIIETRKKPSPEGGLFASLTAPTSQTTESSSPASLSGRSASSQESAASVIGGAEGGLFSSLLTKTDPITLPSPKTEELSTLGEPLNDTPPPAGLFASLEGGTTQKASRSNILSGLEKRPSPPLRGSSRSKATAPKRDLKVLYAEDNVINQKILSKMLSRAGIDNDSITIVDNGKKAVDICENVKFDCIFMDMQMPVMDGMEATRLIVERDPKAIVYFVSAHAMEEYRSQAAAVGAQGFYSKPFRLADIEAVLDNLGNVGGAAEEANALAPKGSNMIPETATAPQSQKASLTKSQAPECRGLKVLYAEDNIVNQKVLSRILHRAGGVTDITIVGNGKAAVDLCRKEKFDCVFMDMEMPIMGGREATKLIVENDPNAIVVIVTAYTEEEVKDIVGAWRFITKPFRLKGVEDFLKLLKARLEKSNPNWNRILPVQAQSPQDTETKANPKSQPPKDTETKPRPMLAPKEKPPVKVRDLKVLYAEDNLINQKVLSKILNRAGIDNIQLVDNGKTAVEMCQTTKYDCIFMDMQMPIMDGVEACRLIVADDPNARVVFVTAHALDEFKAQAVATGATSFITKPFRMSDIQKVLADLNL